MPTWLTIILIIFMLGNILIALKNKNPQKKKIKYAIIFLLVVDIILLLISIKK